VEEGALRPAIAIMARELAAIVRARCGTPRRGDVDLRDAAAKAEMALPPPLGLPAPIKPAPELPVRCCSNSDDLAKRSNGSSGTLSAAPTRTLSVLGLARALAAVRPHRRRAPRYTEVLANFEHADPICLS
jgi:hypothetical protein